MESLYSVDLSLFSGDLLGGWSPSVKPAASEGVSDGWKDATLEVGAMLTSTPIEPLSPVTEFQESSPFSSEWLDTKVDLLDYLAGPELEGLQHEVLPEGNVLTEIIVVEDPTARAVQVLKSIAEDNSALLEESPSSPPSEVPATPLPMDSPSADFLNLFADRLDDSVVDSALDPSSILAPMSPQDIDEILSSGPCSPVSVLDTSLADSLHPLDSSSEVSVSEADLSLDLVQLLNQVQAQEPAWEDNFSSSPQAMPASPPQQPEPVVAYHRPKPYERPRKPGSTKGLPREVIQMERKLRKKQQNKDAATRYRQKKKAEANGINGECDELEQRNAGLREKVDSMTKEISYLKDLLAEVYAAKGLSLPKKCK